MTTVPTTTRPIVLDDDPDPHPVLTVKLAQLRATNPALYATITGRDPITDQHVTSTT